MGFGTKKEEQLKKMPIIRSAVFKSESGRYMVHRTIITDVKPIEYYEKVLESTAASEDELLEEIAL